MGSEATALEEELKASECAARTTLAFFDEDAPPGGALAALQAFLAQLANFSRDLGLAVDKVQEQEERRARAEAPARRRSSTGGVRRSSSRAGLVAGSPAHNCCHAYPK